MEKTTAVKSAAAAHSAMVRHARYHHLGKSKSKSIPIIYALYRLWSDTRSWVQCQYSHEILRCLKYSKNSDYFPLTQTWDLPIHFRPTDTQPSFAIFTLKKFGNLICLISRDHYKVCHWALCKVHHWLWPQFNSDDMFVTSALHTVLFRSTSQHKHTYTRILVRKTKVITFESYAAGKKRNNWFFL